MKKIILCIAVLSSVAAAAVDYTIRPHAQIMKELDKAIAWYKEGTPESLAKADYIVEAVAAEQIRDPESSRYGSMGWWFGTNKKAGLNMANFLTHQMWIDLWPLQDRMSPKTREEYLKTCELILVCAQRRFDEEKFPLQRDNIEYTNAYLMSIQNITIGAWRLGDERLKRKAVSQWKRFYNLYQMSACGEFMSADYDNTDFEAIIDIWRYTEDENVRAQAKEVLDEMYVTECAGSHPVLKLPVVGSSRDYRDFLKHPDGRAKFLISAPEDYEIPEKAKELQTARRYPFEFEGKAGNLPFTFKSYQLKDAAMGTMTGWGDYFCQEQYLVAASGTSTEDRAVMFSPGIYLYVNGFTDQKGLSTLLVYNRKPTLWHIMMRGYSLKDDISRTFDPFGIGINDAFREVENEPGHLVLRAGEYDYHVFGFEVSEGGIGPCEMRRVSRDNLSPSGRYKPRKMVFDEYLFPDKSEWVGAVVKMVKAGTKVKTPVINYGERGDLTTFDCKSENLHLDIALTEQGASVSLPKENLDLMPRRRMSQ